MKEISYSGKIGYGLKFQVSDKSFKEVSKYKWWLSRQGYAVTQIRTDKLARRWTMITLQRFLKNFPKGFEIDHRDQNKHNYQLSNLRVSTHQENGMNRSRQKNNFSSKYKGVCWHEQRQKWYARIHYCGKTISCGLFDSEINAAKSYDKQAKKLFGKFANLNFKK